MQVLTSYYDIVYIGDQKRGVFKGQNILKKSLQLNIRYGNI